MAAYPSLSDLHKLDEHEVGMPGQPGDQGGLASEGDCLCDNLFKQNSH